MSENLCREILCYCSKRVHHQLCSADDSGAVFSCSILVLALRKNIWENNLVQIGNKKWETIQEKENLKRKKKKIENVITQVFCEKTTFYKKYNTFYKKYNIFTEYVKLFFYLKPQLHPHIMPRNYGATLHVLGKKRHFPPKMKE